MVIQPKNLKHVSSDCPTVQVCLIPVYYFTNRPRADEVSVEHKHGSKGEFRPVAILACLGERLFWCGFDKGQPCGSLQQRQPETAALKLAAACQQSIGASG